VVLRDAAGQWVGRAHFRGMRGYTKVRVVLHRIPDGFARSDFHGLHLHANDDPANGEGCLADPNQPPATWFLSADGHFNPSDSTHGDRTGDMPSPYVMADGSAKLSFATDAFRPRDVVGRALILHAKRNNFGNVGSIESSCGKPG